MTGNGPVGDRLCFRMARDQYGVFSRQQALASGLTRQALARRVARGSLQVLYPGVFLLTGAPLSWRTRLIGACYWAGQCSAASHRSAARLWGWSGFAGPEVEISTVNRKRTRELELRVHRVDHHLCPEIVSVDRLPATSARRTLLDLAGIKHTRTESALDQALIGGLTSLADLWMLYEQEWTRGRRGVAILRSMLRDRTRSEAPTRTVLERLLLRAVRKGNLPSPIQQLPVQLPGYVAHLDFAYPKSSLAIECDSYAWHLNRRAFERDRERDIHLQAQGWTVLRFTWARLKWDPDWVAEQIARHLRGQ